SIVGNRFSSSVPSSWVAVIHEGLVDFRGNTANCTNGIKVTGSLSTITGGGNRFIHEGSGVDDVAVLFNLSGSSMVDWNMDRITGSFKNSYVTDSGSS